MTEHQLKAAPAVLYCEVHPDRETSLRCNRCGRPMCTRCAVRTPVGYRCRECVREQQDKFFNAARFDYLIAGAVAVVLGGIGAVIISIVGFFYLSFFISPVAGAITADAAHRAVGRRRGRYTWLVVAGGIVLGALPVGLLAFGGLDWWIYLVMAPGAAVGRLRIGRGRLRLGR